MIQFEMLYSSSRWCVGFRKNYIDLEQSITRVIIVLCRMQQSNIYTYVSHFLRIKMVLENNFDGVAKLLPISHNIFLLFTNQNPYNVRDIE